jgi:hypothetical protein
MRVGYSALYAYAWDLIEIGMLSALDHFCAWGLDTVTMAAMACG